MFGNWTHTMQRASCRLYVRDTFHSIYLHACRIPCTYRSRRLGRSRRRRRWRCRPANQTLGSPRNCSDLESTAADSTGVAADSLGAAEADLIGAAPAVDSAEVTGEADSTGAAVAVDSTAVANSTAELSWRLSGEPPPSGPPRRRSPDSWPCSGRSVFVALAVLIASERKEVYSRALRWTNSAGAHEYVVSMSSTCSIEDGVRSWPHDTISSPLWRYGSNHQCVVLYDKHSYLACVLFSNWIK
jgi:hypothetical protein